MNQSKGLMFRCIAFVTLAASASAVINPNFTPADLVNGSSQIVLLKVSAPTDKGLAAESVETLKGAPLPNRKLRFELSEASDLTQDEIAAVFDGATTATALLLLAPAKDKGGPAGFIQIGTQWFAVSQQENAFLLERDKQGMFSVWAGSARMLAEAARYVLTDDWPVFPVRSEITWGSDLRLGKLTGAANGCVVADFGGPIGICVVVLSDGGDRVYQVAAKGTQPADVTQKVKLNTASKTAATGDFNGDGRIDLASWDGRAIGLALQNSDGTLSVRSTSANLTECFSLSALSVASKAGAGVVAGTSKGPVLLTPNTDGNWRFRAVTSASQPADTGSPGSGGMCVVADFDNDGHNDIMQVFSSGLTLYGGKGAGLFKPPIHIPIALVKQLRTSVCGDYDTDGRLDIVVGGDDGLALLSRTPDGCWENATLATGELVYHGNANRPALTGGGPCDVNNDGHQGVALFYRDRNPMVFFNRGFSCFGLARELELSGAANIATADDMTDPFAAPAAETKLKAAETLQGGQTAGILWDLNGDAVQDLLSVDLSSNVWVLFGKRDEGKALALTVALSPNAIEPLTLTVSNENRRIGMHVLRPGAPVFIGRPEPGPLTLRWRRPNGETRTQTVILEKPARIEIAP